MATAATINIPAPALLMTSTTKPTSSSPGKKSYKAWLREKHLPKAAPIEQCNSDLFSKLDNLTRLSILRQSLAPSDNTNEFEILEFYGDSVLYERISFFLMHTRRFMSPHLLTKLRMSIINNKNLASVYDVLGLQSLVSSPEGEITAVKGKADVVEAVIGELSEAANKTGPGGAAALVRTVLDELLSYICYTGEQSYFAEESREKMAAATAAALAAAAALPSPPPPPLPVLPASPSSAIASSAPASPPPVSGRAPRRRNSSPDKPRSPRRILSRASDPSLPPPPASSPAPVAATASALALSRPSVPTPASANVGYGTASTDPLHDPAVVSCQIGGRRVLEYRV